ncbi:MAG: nucleotidyltransferase domain-containing protein [Hyphomicrobium sp.]
MSRDDIIAGIKANAAALHALGAGAVYLYGSYARDAATPTSDVDLFIDRDPIRRFTFIELTEIEFLLRKALGQTVDVSTRTGLHPALRREIEQHSIRVL